MFISSMYLRSNNIKIIIISLLVMTMNRPVLDQNLYNIGMKNTSTTFASATVNVLPAITFVMAVVFR